MRDTPAEVALVIPSELLIHDHECPRWLPLHPATVARNPDHIKCLKSFDQTIGKKKVVNPDIIMNEHEDVIAICCRNAWIEDVREPLPVFESETGNQTSIMCKPSQRLAQRRLPPKIRF